MQKMSLLKYFWVVLFFSIIIDQFLKHKIRHDGGFYLCNSGISFGVQLPDVIFWLICGIFFLVFVMLLLKKASFPLLFLCGLALFGGGVLSNIIDRVFFGCVLDYIFFFKKFFPAFNIADGEIFLGSCLMLSVLLPRPASRSE